MRRFAAAGAALGLVTVACAVVLVLTGGPTAGQPNEKEGPTMSTSENSPPDLPEVLEEPAIDYLEEPLIDGPEPMTRKEFARDAKPDANTADRPPQPIGEEGSASGGESSVIERTTE